MSDLRKAAERARKALTTAQNNLAPSRASAFAFGNGELWDEYEIAMLGLNAALAEPEQSEPSPFGWVKSSEVEQSKRFGGSINLWREKYDCDVPVYLAAPQRREPLKDTLPSCNTHPDAPHGCNRTASLSLRRYVCDCEGWKP
jgi:hypothetical protein